MLLVCSSGTVPLPLNHAVCMYCWYNASTSEQCCLCASQMWVAEPSKREDLRVLVLAYLQGTSPKPPVDNAVDFYQAAKAAAVSSHADCLPLARSTVAQDVSKL